MGPYKQDDRRGGYITIKAVHVWGPFALQLVVLIGGWFTLQQKVTDLQATVDHLEHRIEMLEQRMWK